MLIKLLPQRERVLLLELAELLLLSGSPLQLSGTTLHGASIILSEQMKELIADLDHSAKLDDALDVDGTVIFPGIMRSHSSVERELVQKLKSLPIHEVELPDGRAQAATAVLKQLLSSHPIKRPESPKIILFELLLITLRNGPISSMELRLLKELQQHYHVSDFIFDDLLESAKALNSEVTKAIAIVLE